MKNIIYTAARLSESVLWLTIFANCFLPTANCFAQKIASGGEHKLLICSGGTVKSWGRDTYGELGNDATLADQNVPVTVAGLTGIIAVSAGWDHSLALDNTGTVWSWGRNAYGQLGDGTAPVNQPTPVAVPGLTGIIAISAGGRHSLALKNDGTVWAWGYNTDGELGDNTTVIKLTPVQVKGPGAVGFLTGIIAVSAGWGHSLALDNTGKVWSWGSDSNGQLGDDPAFVAKLTPVAVAGLTGITAIDAGRAHSLAVKNDGTVWAWGYNTYGNLGDNTTVDKPTPVQVKGPGAVGFLTGIVAIATGGDHSLAIDNTGKAWSWGFDGSTFAAFGELGDDAVIADKFAPVAVAAITGVTDIAAGLESSFALDNTGKIWVWGDDYFGQLGIGTTGVHQPMPVQVSVPCVPLPITLLSFTAGCQSAPNTVRVAWSTASETNNDYFTIERSTSPNPSKGGGLNWEVAGTVKGAGNSSTVRSYEFIDNQVLPFGEDLGGVVYYRLTQTDFDGKTETFNDKQIAVDITACATQVFPNPVGNTLNVPYSTEQGGEITLQVFDVIGKLVKDKTVAAVKGNNKFTLDLTTVAQGMYVLKIKSGNGEQQQKFVKQ